MAGFLRKFATRKSSPLVEQNTPPVPSDLVSDAPPSLPPLFARFATSTLDEPDSISLFSSYISSPTPLANPVQDPISLHTLGDSDTRNPPIDPTPKPKKVSSKPPLPAAPRRYTGPGLPPKQITLSRNGTCSDSTDTYSSPPSSSASPSSSTPRTIHAVSTRQDRNQQHSISATPPIATVIRDSVVVSSPPLLSPVQLPPPLLSQHDLTKSFSPITNTRGSSHPASPSLDNQVPSYTPLNTRYSTSASQDSPSLLGLQTVDPLQKPPSTSSHTSSTTQSSSNHSDATRITNSGSVSTAFTSTSSIAPAIKQINVTPVETHGRSPAGLRLARANPFSPRSSAHLNSTSNSNAPSSTVEQSHLPPIHHRPQTAPSPAAAAEPPSRNLTHSTTITTKPSRSTAAPPTQAPRTMPPRQNVHSPAARPFTHADATSHHTAPLKPVHARAVSIEVTTPPVRKGPLIFASMASISPPGDTVVLNMDPKAPITVSAPTPQAPALRNVIHDGPGVRGYPSPPAEYASLDQASTRRVASLSSHGHGRVSNEAGRMSSMRERGSVHEHVRPPSEAGHMLSEVGAFTPPTRKLSKSGATEHVSEAQNSKPRVLTKSSRSRSRPPTPSSSSSSPPKLRSPNLHSEPLFSEDALFFDADPFAKVDGVQVMKMHAVASSVKDKDECGTEVPAPAVPVTPPTQPQLPLTPESPEDYKSARTQRRGLWLEKSRPPVVADVNVQQEVMSKEAELLLRDEEERVRKEKEKRQKEEEERRAREEIQRIEEEKRRLEEQRLKEEEEERLRREASIYPIMKHMSDPSLLPHLLVYLTFSDWCSLYGATKEIRQLFESRVLREYVLEHFLCTIGYSRWNFEWAEPLALSLKDLNNYMRGVSMPTYQYAQLAEAYLKPRVSSPGYPTPQVPNILSLAMTTRAYTRVVLRLRAQAESEARVVARAHITSVTSMSRSSSRTGTRDKQTVVSRMSNRSSRAPSPSSSYTNSHGRPSVSDSKATFRSPLVKLHRAPLLRAFVPSPEGEWLSDSSVVECEAELRRAGVLKLLRVGDVVWDVAVGDEGNLGRMVWDGSYLVDLDHKYSRMGELSPLFHSLAFAPSYFHRVIRTGVHPTLNPEGNPIVYIDVSPWGKELATNLQLLQDRAMTTTPHGTLHSVMRWVHRSSFTIRPPVSAHHPHAYSHLQNLRLPIPNVDGFFIDPGWYGSVVVEAEGTNEGLADLQDRCGPGAFPPRADNVASKIRSEKEKNNRRVFRVMREKSRPGEIWIRAVRDKERVM